MGWPTHLIYILQSCNLHQQITTPTRITQYSKSLIDHVISNKARCVSYSDVLSFCWRPRCPVCLLELRITPTFHRSHSMLEACNTLIKDCINRHAPLKRVKITRPPCPCLKTSDIAAYCKISPN